MDEPDGTIIRRCSEDFIKLTRISLQQGNRHIAMVKSLDGRNYKMWIRLKSVIRRASRSSVTGV